MEIRETTAADLEDILTIERDAFGDDEVAELVRNLLADPSARPLISLIACEQGRAVGNILFTTARLAGAEEKFNVSILAPLAVFPQWQKQGVGGQLVREGLAAPYPIEEKNADAWMVQALSAERLGTVSGKIVCAEAMDKPEYWRE